MATVVYTKQDAPQTRRVVLCSADVTNKEALPQNRVYMMIGSQADFNNKLRNDTFSSDTTLLYIRKLLK